MEVTFRYTPQRVLRGLKTRSRIYVEGVSSVVPKLIYGNSAGFTNNFGPLRELSELRRRSPLAASFLEEEPYASAAARLTQAGYLLFPSQHPPALLESIRADYLRHLESPEHSVTSSNGASRFLLEPHVIVPQMRELLTEQFCRTLTAYYGCALRIQSVRAWRNYGARISDPYRDDVYSNTFHHDTTPVTGVRVFVLLCDGVTRETGALRFQDKPNSRSIVRSLGYFHRSKMPSGTRQRLADGETLRYFEGNLGDACICNTQECLHAAGVPSPGASRDVLQFEIYPSDGPYRSRDALFDTIPPDIEIRNIGLPPR